MLQLWQPIFKMGGQRLHTYIFTLIFIVWNRSLHNSLLPANSEKKWEKNSKSTLAFSEGNYLGFFFLIMIFLVMIWKAEIHRLINRIVNCENKQAKIHQQIGPNCFFFLLPILQTHPAIRKWMIIFFIEWMSIKLQPLLRRLSCRGHQVRKLYWMKRKAKQCIPSENYQSDKHLSRRTPPTANNSASLQFQLPS